MKKNSDKKYKKSITSDDAFELEYGYIDWGEVYISDLIEEIEDSDIWWDSYRYDENRIRQEKLDNLLDINTYPTFKDILPDKLK